MSTIADSIRRGLEQALAFAEGKADPNAFRVHVPQKIAHSTEFDHLFHGYPISCSTPI